jgi:hypothetical protein
MKNGNINKYCQNHCALYVHMYSVCTPNIRWPLIVLFFWYAWSDLTWFQNMFNMSREFPIRLKRFRWRMFQGPHLWSHLPATNFIGCFSIQTGFHHPPPYRLGPGAVFTEAKSGIYDPRLFQRRHFCPDFRFVWIKCSRWRNLISHWLLCWAGLWFQPIVSDFLYCRKLFKNSTNFQQKFPEYLISTNSSRSFPHCE